MMRVLINLLDRAVEDPDRLLRDARKLRNRLKRKVESKKFQRELVMVGLRVAAKRMRRRLV